MTASMSESRRVINYGIVGLMAAAIDFGILLILAKVMPYLLANTIAFLIAFACNFAAAHTYVFGRPLSTSALVVELPGVAAIGLIGVALSNIALFLLHNLVALELPIAKILTVILVAAWNYAGRRRFVYVDCKP